MRRSGKTYGGACVLLAALTLAIWHSAPRRKQGKAPLTDEQARAFYEDAMKREVQERTLALERFRSSEWSQQDDFHAQEAGFLRDYARTHRLSVESTLAALDEGMRRRWPTEEGAEPQQRIVPCRPRLTY